MNNRLPGLPETVPFAMPTGDEQADLDGSATACLEEEGKKTILNHSQDFQGFLFIWLSLKDSQVLHHPLPSLIHPPSGFICLKIAREETTLLLFYIQTK